MVSGVDAVQAKKYYFSPSMMCADFMKLSEQIEVINRRADFYHIDIMDGHYVKNITLSPMFVSQIRERAALPIDVHLMVENPDDYVEELAGAGADYISPHAEMIDRNAFRTISKIKGLGCKAGIVVNPAMPLDHISEYISLLDKITIMTVEPGFAGQKFIPRALEKIEKASKLKKERGYDFLIEADGSCNQRTFGMLKGAGCEVFIIGTSGLFSKDPDLDAAFDKMYEEFGAV